MERVGEVAVIFPPPGGDWTPALISVAGISVFTRVLLAAERAGIKQFFILSRNYTTRLRELLAERVIKAEVHWFDTDPSRFIKYLQKKHLSFFSLNAATLFDPEIFRHVVEAFGDDAEVLLPAMSNDTDTIGGVALAAPHLLFPFSQIIEQEKLSDWLDFLTFSKSYKNKIIHLPRGTLFLDASSQSFNEIENSLYRSLGKSSDTTLIRLTRKAAIPLVRRLAITSATPNHVTIAGFLIGLCSIGLFLGVEYVFVVSGAILFTLSYVVDLADGMIARLKFTESRTGALLDYVLDNITHLGLFASLVWVVHARSPEKPILFLGGLLLGGSLLSAILFGWYQKKKGKGLGKGPVLRQHMERIVEAFRHRDFAFFLLIAAIFNRVDWFFYASVIGVNFFWIINLLLIIMGVREVSKT